MQQPNCLIRIPTERSSKRFSDKRSGVVLIPKFLGTLLVILGISAALVHAGTECLAADTTPGGSQIEIAKSLELIRQVGPEGAGFEEAQLAVKNLVANRQATVFHVLEGMKDATPEAKNWLRGIAGTLQDRDQPTLEALQEFFGNRDNDRDARYLVFRWIGERDENLKEKLLDAATDDPSLPLRFLAISKVLDKAKQLAAQDAAESKRLLQTVFVDGRNPEQLRAAATAMKELGQEVSLSRQLGMFSDWYVIGPFDNTNGQGFDAELDIEQGFIKNGADSFDSAASFAGKSTDVKWQSANTQDSMGSLDLNPIFENTKDAVCYAFCRFRVEKGGTAEGRIGSINANKVWVNGQLITANEVYHAGSMIDQYIGTCELQAGENWVLVKICQNNQTESWAQDWQFQFRLTDDTGKPLELEITSPLQVSQ